ncbi:hypothetical protein ACJZ2D_016817 [Fusarium nematophilum]
MARVTAHLRLKETAEAVRNNAKRFTRSSRNNTKTPSRQAGSYRDVAEKLKISVGKLQRLDSKEPPGKRWRPRLVSEAEEAGLVAYVVWLERSGFPAERSQVEEAAREFRLSRGYPNTPFNKNWYSRFRQRHEELKVSHIKAVDKARKASAKAQRSGKSLEEWFGCDKWLREPGRRCNVYKKPPLQRPKQKKI